MPDSLGADIEAFSNTSRNSGSADPILSRSGKSRKESEITRGRREKCKDQCLALKDFCLERKRKLEDAENVQKELENEMEETEEYSGGDTFPEYATSPSDSNIYKWTDKDGVIHITNKIDSIPPEYLEQVKHGTNEESKINKGESESD